MSGRVGLVSVVVLAVGTSDAFAPPVRSSVEVPSGSAGQDNSVDPSRTRVAADATIGFDHIPTSIEVEGVGFFTSWYVPPETGTGWRLGVLYTPAQDEQPLEYWALISGDVFAGNTFDITRVPIWSTDIHEGLDHFIAIEHGDVYHAQHATWDHSDTTAYATNGVGLPIHLIGFDIAPGLSLRAGVEYVISIAILDSFHTNGFAGVTQFPGEVPSAVQVSEQLADGWHFTSESEFNRFSGGVSTRLVSSLDNCPEDPNKTEPGICGCGVDDNADADSDGIPDCIDQCPDSDDGAAGALGDADGDGVLNCNDLCPGADDAVFGDCTGTIPTVSVWGLLILALLLLAGSKVVFRDQSLRDPFP